MKIGTETVPVDMGENSTEKLVLIADTQAENRDLERIHSQLASDYQVKYSAVAFSLTIELKRK